MFHKKDKKCKLYVKKSDIYINKSLINKLYINL